MKLRDPLPPKGLPDSPSSPKDYVDIGTARDGSLLTITDKQRERHMYCIGVSGSGKTQMLKHMLWQDLDRGMAVVVFDPVGSLVPPTLERMRAKAFSGELRARSLPMILAGWARRRLARRLAKIIVIDFADPDCPWRWNPLEFCDGLTKRDLGLGLAAAVERIVEGDMAQMRQLLQLLTCLGFVVAQAGGVVSDLVSLCCADTATLEEFIGRITRRLADGRLRLAVRRDILMEVFQSFFAQTSHRERRDLVASTLRALTMILSDPIAERFLSARRGTLRLSEVMEGKRALLVHIPPRNRFTHPVICGFLLDRLKTLALRRTAQEAAEGPQVIVYIDEFQTVFTPQLAEEIAILRNKKLSFVLAHQTSSQPPFHTPEGRSLLQAVRDNASTHIWMRVGQRDAEEVAGMIFRPGGNSMIQLDYDDITHTEGTSRTLSLARSVSQSISEAFAEGTSSSVSVSLGTSGTLSYSESHGIARTQTKSLTLTRGKAFSRAVSRSTGVAVTIGGSEILVEGYGRSTSLSRSSGRSQSSSAGGSLGARVGQSLPLAPGQEVGMPAASLSGGQMHGQSWSDSVSNTLAESIGQVISQAASMARGRSWSQSTSRSRSSSRSKTVSESRSEGRSIAEGMSVALGCVQSLGRTLTRAESESRSQTRTSSRGRTGGETATTSRGQTSGRSVRHIKQYYSLDDETQMRAFELMDLPGRTAWVVIRGDGPARRVKIRTLDVKQEFTTKLGAMDGARILDELCPVPDVQPEPDADIFERLRSEELARTIANGSGGVSDD